MQEREEFARDLALLEGRCPFGKPARVSGRERRVEIGFRHGAESVEAGDQGAVEVRGRHWLRGFP